jgi:hypothetical protein
LNAHLAQLVKSVLQLQVHLLHVQQASQAPSGQDSALHHRLVHFYRVKQWQLRAALQVNIKIRLVKPHASIVTRDRHVHQQVLHQSHAQLANFQLKVLLPVHHALQVIYAVIKLKQVKLHAFMDSILILLLPLMSVKYVLTVINALRMQF